MKLPFQINKTFTTTLSKNEVIGFVREKLNKRSKSIYIANEYSGSIDKLNFNFYKISTLRYKGSKPIISGKITATNPTTIDIKISPHYYRIIFFLIFPLVFIPTAFLTDKMTINGLLRRPELSERILFGLIGVGPAIWGYYDSITPLKETESWIKDKLQLKKTAA